jgi:hypothetical protein
VNEGDFEVMPPGAESEMKELRVENERLRTIIGICLFKSADGIVYATFPPSADFGRKMPDGEHRRLLDEVLEPLNPVDKL